MPVTELSYAGKVTATQRCPQCGQDKTQSEYAPYTWGKPGGYCRPCRTAYMRTWKIAHGYPVRQPKQPKPPKPPRQPSMSYSAVHCRVRHFRGRAPEYQCSHCDKQANEWAYDHNDPEPLTVEKKPGVWVEYSADINRYLPLCYSCHARFDGRAATPAHSGHHMW